MTVTEPKHGCREVNKGRKMRIHPIIARGYAPRLLEAVEEPLNGVSLGVANRIKDA